MITIAGSSAILFHSCIQLAQVGDLSQPCFKNNTCLPGLGCFNGYCQNSGYTWTDNITGIEWTREAALYMSWSDANSYCNSLNTKDYSGWHLPSIDELRTVVQGCPSTQPGGSCGVKDGCLSSQCNANCGCGNTRCYMNTSLSGDCDCNWSSSMVTDINDNAWTICFNSAGISTNKKTNGIDVRCARAGSPGDGGYDGGGGNDGGGDGGYDGGGGQTWKDVTTGLEWMQYAGTFMSQQQAVTYCSNSTYAGKTGWHLPTISELRTIIQGCTTTSKIGTCLVNDSNCLNSGCGGGVCNGCAYGGGPAPGGCYWDVSLTGMCQSYWSSMGTTDITDSYWAVDYTTGKVFYSNQSLGYYIRCVRTF